MMAAATGYGAEEIIGQRRGSLRNGFPSNPGRRSLGRGGLWHRRAGRRAGGIGRARRCPRASSQPSVGDRFEFAQPVRRRCGDRSCKRYQAALSPRRSTALQEDRFHAARQRRPGGRSMRADRRATPARDCGARLPGGRSHHAWRASIRPRQAAARNRGLAPLRNGSLDRLAGAAGCGRLEYDVGGSGGGAAGFRRPRTSIATLGRCGCRGCRM